MINFILGRSGSGKSTAVLNGIKKDIASGKKVYLIVPEQQAVVWESRAARALDPSAFLSLDIVGFSRLANLVCRKYGGLSYDYITRGEKALVMWSAILSVRDHLKIYAGADGQEDRSVPLMTDAVSELKRYKVTPAMLEKAASELDFSDPASQSLSDRLSDLALIYSSYESLIADRFDDADDELSKLDKTLAVHDFFGGSSVYIDSYFSFTPDQYGIIESVMRQADDVTVAVTMDKDSGEAQFSYTERTYKSLVSMCAALSKEYKNTVLPDDVRRTDPMLRFLEGHLFDNSGEVYSGEYTNAVRVVMAGDRYDECAAVAAEICRLVHNGARYGDIAVIAHDINDLSGMIDRALDAEGIKYHLFRRTRLAAEPAARLIFSALSLVSGGWQTDDFIALAKTGLFMVTDDECDSLETYAKTWRLRGIRAFGSGWNMNPDGYTDVMTERGASRLALANSARDKLFPPLSNFADAVSGGVVSLTSICKACYDLLTETDVYRSLEKRAMEYDLGGRHDEAVRTRQVFRSLCDALDTVAITLPDGKADPARFARLLRRVIDEADIGTIPSSADEVILGSASSVRTDEVKHVFIVGANDGEFPGVPDENGFFSDTDKILLEGSGIVLSEKADDMVAAELFSFYRAVSSASESLTVFIPQTDKDGALLPSDAAERIMKLFPLLSPVYTADYSPADLVWSKSSLPSAAARLTGRYTGFDEDAAAFAELYKDTDNLMSADGCALTKDSAEAVTGEKMSLSQSRMDTFVLCRFDYLCKYVLKLGEEKQAAIKPVDIGNFIHRILELYYTETKGRELPIPDEETDAITDRLITEYMDLVLGGRRSARLSYLFARLKRSVRLFISVFNREFAQSEFRPYRFELPVAMSDDGSAPPPLVFSLPDGTEVTVRGKIDRMDTYTAEDGRTYVRVVDYKTGAKDFSLSDIKLGLNMQLLLYLFTLWKCPPSEFRRELAGDGEIVPAGALYLGVRPNETNVNSPVSASEAEALAEASLTRKGIMLADEDLLRKMDSELSGRYIPVKIKKDGGFTSTSSVASLARFGELYGEIEGNIKRIAVEMREGRSDAKPMKTKQLDPCRYCRHKAVCRSAGAREGGEADG